MSLLGQLMAGGLHVEDIPIVQNSAEFQRISALPRRVLDLAITTDVTDMFRKPGGTLRFWPIQSAAIIEAARRNGLFAPIGVGHGKTLIALALPAALDSERAVILVKPDLKRQLEREIDTFYTRHFDLPIDRITIVSYVQLSSARHADVLDECDPDLVVADEAHCLRHRSAARTKRFLRFMKEHPTCRFAALSGTMTTRSIKDYAHLIELALGRHSPLPGNYREVEDWAGVLDPKPAYKMRPGVLVQLCAPGENVRQGFQRRQRETEGYVSTDEGAIGTDLWIRRKTITPPSEISSLIDGVQKTWSLDGEEFESPVEVSNCLRQLVCGFHYVWDWPGEPDTEWLTARSDWHREVRQKLKGAKAGMDSPLLLANAAERYHAWDQAGRTTPRPELCWDSAAWPAWRAVKDRPKPPTIPIWHHDYMVDAAIQWGRREGREAPAIIWYLWATVGERIARKGGFPLYGEGTDASTASARVIVASIRCQGTGKNLQRYSRNLLTSVPPNGTTFEQLAGRTHRPGQAADEVLIDWFDYEGCTVNEDGMAQVIEDARFVAETQGEKQKVLFATKL